MAWDKQKYRDYAREWTRKNRDRLNALRRERYRLNPLYLKKSQERLARWKGGILKIITERKMQTGCERCGYKKYYGSLDFHHKNKSDKLFGLANARTRPHFSKEQIITEMDKCIVLCKNCHAEVHKGL